MGRDGLVGIDWLRAGRSVDRIPRGGADFPNPSRQAPGPNQHPVQWIPSLSPGLKRPARGVDHPPASTA